MEVPRTAEEEEVLLPQFKDSETLSFRIPVAEYFAEELKKNDRWGSIVRYLVNIWMEDLHVLSCEDILEEIPAEDRLLTKIFIKRYLERFFCSKKDRDPFAFPRPEKAMKPMEEQLPSIHAIWDLSGKVLPKKLMNLWEQGKTKLIPIVHLPAMAAKEAENVRVLDLASSNLLDDDLPFIVEAVTILHKCEKVILTANRFHGNRDKEADECLRKLLALDHVRFVDIKRSPMASNDRRGLFENLTEEEYKKLIFIPRQWVQPLNWFGQVPDICRMVVYQTHEEFYLHNE